MLSNYIKILVANHNIVEVDLWNIATKDWVGLTIYLLVNALVWNLRYNGPMISFQVSY